VEPATTALGHQPVRAVKVQPAKASQREDRNDAFLNSRQGRKDKQRGG
jgi:hypothetical protein